MRKYKFRGKIIYRRTRFLKTLGYKVGDWIYGENISVEHDDIEPDKIQSPTLYPSVFKNLVLRSIIFPLNLYFLMF